MILYMYDIELSNIYTQINYQYKIVKYLLGKFTRLGIGKRKYWGTLQLNNYIHGIHGIFLTTSKSYSSTLNIYMENRPLLNQNKSINQNTRSCSHLQTLASIVHRIFRLVKLSTFNQIQVEIHNHVKFNHVCSVISQIRGQMHVHY